MGDTLKTRVLSNELDVDDKLLERIADDTAKELKQLSKQNRPKKIYLYNANQGCLVKIMLMLYDRLKPIKVEIFTTEPPDTKLYSVDVGHYLGLNHPEVS